LGLLELPCRSDRNSIKYATIPSVVAQARPSAEAPKDPADARLGKKLIKQVCFLEEARLYHWEATTSYRLDTPDSARSLLRFGFCGATSQVFGQAMMTSRA
jgi:hypothetical protein